MTTPTALSRSVFTVGALLAFVAGAGFAFGLAHDNAWVDREASIQNPSEWSDAAASIPVDSNDPIWGARDALVTIVVFSDMQCPYCAELEKNLETVKRTIDPREVRIIWKNSPLRMHKDARPAAIAGNTVFRLAGSRAFWAFTATAFANQNHLDLPHFLTWASDLGIDPKRFEDAIASNEFAAKVEGDIGLADSLMLGGVPASFVNGVLVVGAASPSRLRQVIHEELANAKAHPHVPRDRMYVTLCEENHPRATDAAVPPVDEHHDSAAPEHVGDLDKTVYHLPFLPGDVPRGPAEAPVTLVELADFSPSARAAAAPIDHVLANFEGKIRFVFRPITQSQDRDLAGALFASADKRGATGFWAAHDLLFGPTPPADPLTALGLSAADVHAQAIDQRIGDANASAMAIELPAVPACFVNGRRVLDITEARLGAMVDEEIANAARRVEAGAAPADLYASIVDAARPLPPPEKREIEGLAAHPPGRGPAKAKVTVEVFGDFQAPYSKRSRPLIDALEAAFPGEVRVVWRFRPLPTDPLAVLAAEAALEAFAQKGDAGFWAYADALFEAQTRGPTAFDEKSLVALAKQLGFDREAFEKALSGHTHRKDVEQDARAADQAGVIAVPSYAINGYFLSGNVPLARLERTVALAVAEAK